MSKKIILINGHSVKDSFCEAIGKSYIDGAKKEGAEVKSINLYKLKFNPILSSGYKSKKNQALEKDLKNVQEGIKWADHVVFVYPIWWGEMPAILKGFLDRAFTPGFAFDPTHKKHGMPKGLLAGKSSRIIITMGAPTFAYKLFFRKAATKIMKSNLKYCGIKNIKASHFGQIDSSSENKRKEILKQVKHLGRNMQ